MKTQKIEAERMSVVRYIQRQKFWNGPTSSHRQIKSSNKEAYDVSNALLIVTQDQTLKESLIILWNEQITNLCKHIN